MGDKTPADLVLFASTDLKIDNSSLTGESEPQERYAKPDGANVRPVEAENLLFNSTLVVNGEGWGGTFHHTNIKYNILTVYQSLFALGTIR